MNRVMKTKSNSKIKNKQASILKPITACKLCLDYEIRIKDK
jgi:hypothetical protein